ncbi:MAG: tripartite tricarboxylate transporter substrate binding protein [Betaproteobacteria bacterium]|nr:tripartite tricarboxylate transporter substrate binding protein [Betaproteobacteria bacterium]
MCRIYAGAWLAVSLLFAACAHAQDVSSFPAKPIRFVVPFAPGGGTDALARIVGEALHNKWGQPVVIENRGGAGGNIGAEAVYKAEPDGYTLLFTAGGTLTNNKALYGKLNYEPEAFVPVALVVANYSVLVVHPRIPATGVQQLIAYAKANPEKLDYASPGSGTGSHLTGEMFKAMAGVKIAHIPYKGTAPAMGDLVGGQVGSMFAELGSILPHIRAGKVRALAVTSDKRIAALPDVPAVAEVLPGFLATPWTGAVAPPKTPAAIATKLSAGIADILRQPDVAKHLADRSFEAMGSTPEQMTLFMKQETERWDKVIRTIGLKAD